MRKILSFSLVVLLFLLVLPRPTFAFQHQILNEVLGDATTSALPQIAPTSEGPGLILPDSPLFFLDQWKQAVRVFFAFTPQAKAQVYTSIAGQRLAQLRFMLAKNNSQAAQVALQGVSNNLRLAAAEVSQAQFQGQNVSALATQVNDSIKTKQDVLDSLEKSSTGVFNLSVQQAQESLFESKIQVEDSLPDNELQSEVKGDLARRIAERVSHASESAQLLKNDLEELQKEASAEAQTSLKNRQDQLEKLGNKKAAEKLLEAEKTRQEKILEAQQKAAEQAREALDNAENAAVGFQKAQSVINELQSNPATSGASPVPTSNVRLPASSPPENEGGR